MSVQRGDKNYLSWEKYYGSWVRPYGIFSMPSVKGSGIINENSEVGW